MARATESCLSNGAPACQQDQVTPASQWADLQKCRPSASCPTSAAADSGPFELRETLQVSTIITRQKRQRPKLSELLDFALSVRQVQRRYEDSFDPPRPPARGKLAKHLACGRHISEVYRLSLPVAEVRDCLKEIAALLAAENAEASEPLARLWNRGCLDDERLQRLGEAMFSGQLEPLAALAAETEIHPSLVWSLFAAGVGPFAAKAAQPFCGAIEASGWREAGCPFCANAAVSGRRDPETHKRQLRCWLCRSEWAYEAVRCPYCGATESIGCLCDESLPDARIETCEECKGYLKVWMAEQVDEAAAGPVEDVLTAHLDVIAKERGYVWPPLEAAAAAGT